MIKAYINVNASMCLCREHVFWHPGLVPDRSIIDAINRQISHVLGSNNGTDWNYLYKKAASSGKQFPLFYVVNHHNVFAVNLVYGDWKGSTTPTQSGFKQFQFHCDAILYVSCKQLRKCLLLYFF